MSRAMKVQHSTSSRWIRTTRGLIVAEYLLTILHHVDEGLGLAFGVVRLNSLLTPFTFGIPLLITVGFLYLYQETRSRLILLAFTLTTTLWWVIGIGIVDGFYNHTLSVLLVSLRAPLQVMKLVYPSYPHAIVSAPAGATTIPCDGVQFRYCALTPNTVFYEGSGILSFVAACLLIWAIHWLIRTMWRSQGTPASVLPRAVAIGVSLGLAASFFTLPLLGSFMSTGRILSLIIAMPIMGVSVAAIIVAMTWLRRKSAA